MRHGDSDIRGAVISVRRIVALPVLATALALIAFGVVRGVTNTGPGQGTRLAVKLAPPVDDAAVAMAIRTVHDRIDEKGGSTRIVRGSQGLVVEIGEQDPELVGLLVALVERRAKVELRVGETPFLDGDAIRTVEMVGSDLVTIGVARPEALTAVPPGATVAIALDGTLKQTATVARVHGPMLELRIAGATRDATIAAGLELVRVIQAGAVRPMQVTNRTPFTRATGFWPRGLPFFGVGAVLVIVGIVLLWPRRGSGAR
jgi:hypothetical protein